MSAVDYDSLPCHYFKVELGLNIHGLRHSLGNELYDLGLEREARKRMMSHESDAASMIYEKGGTRSRQADKATRALNRKHRTNTAEMKLREAAEIYQRCWERYQRGGPSAGVWLAGAATYWRIVVAHMGPCERHTW